jgi:hypothetical protein
VRKVDLAVASLLGKAYKPEPSSEFDAARQQMLDMLADTDGPRAAAWLLWPYRKSLHEYGEVIFTMPRVIELPPWFRVAIECLRKREGWAVKLDVRLSGRAYTVQWLERGVYRA